MNKGISPYKAHVFICTKTRGNERKSCGDGTPSELVAALKDAIKIRGWKPRVRVSSCGCLGLCEQGPNLMIYPQQIWFSDIKLNDLSEILATLETLLSDGNHPTT